MEALLETVTVYNAVNELREALSEWAHLGRERMFTVRYLLADGDNIVVDIGKQYCTSEIDRFVISYRDRAIVATAGTLGRVRHTQTFARHCDLRAWMGATLQLVSGRQPCAQLHPPL